MRATAAESRRDIVALVISYWRSEQKTAARTILFAILALTLGMVFMNVQINKWQNGFFSALQAKDERELYRQLLRFLLLAGIGLVMSVYSQYFIQMLQIRWRRWLTDNYLAQWLRDHAYYRMQFGGETDNPDQRVAEDLRNFVEQTLGLFLGLLNASATLVSFIGILWTLSGPLTIPWGAGNLLIPGYMVWAAVLYAFFGTWMAHHIGKPLVPLNFAREKVEADFRYGLVKFRGSLEEIALYRGRAKS